ncbi:Hint domain-containing protein [Asaia spathodeae]|uniref:Hint domain-containing protein n=1 Tax=Asaia spathodeae TaxID=657016 RepID=UPI002FC32595
MTNLNVGTTVQIANGGSYVLNGGKVEFSQSDGIAPPPVIATAEIGTGLVYKNSSIGVAFSPDLADTYPGGVWTLNLIGTVEESCRIGYSMVCTNGSISVNGIFDGEKTTISFIATSSSGNVATFKVVMSGNPYLLEQGVVRTINSASAGSGASSSIYGSVTTRPCYLPGTLIETPQGLKPVEMLAVGDEVVVYNNADREVLPSRWVGSQNVVTQASSERPVRIHANALADQVPFKDLVVTPEHCLYIDGRFVPARMLVNDRSIVIDDQTRFTIYHIETEPHAVIKANGMLSESYLDTGNRKGFAVEGTLVVGCFDTRKQWNQDSAAPLDTSRAFVEPIYNAIALRADSLGYGPKQSVVALTSDPDMRLLTSQGRSLQKLRHSGSTHIFGVPAGVQTLWLESRVAMPSETIGSFVDDRRLLGVLVGSMTLFGRAGKRALSMHHQPSALAGWHDCESVLYRWTAGRALIDLEGGDPHGESILAIEIVDAGPYFCCDDDARPFVSAA